MTRACFLATAAGSAVGRQTVKQGHSVWPNVGDRYTVEEGVTAPVVIHRVAPTYTDEARAAGLEGRVVVNCAITPDGRSESIRILVPLGSGLDERAIEAVKQWTFVPANKAGRGS